jgi:hypothetical protein
MRRRSSLLGMIGLLGLVCLGCSQQPNVPVSDEAQAKKIAEKVLDAWKAGGTAEDLKSETPPIFVSEDLWRNKMVLTSYSIKDTKIVGTNVRFEITLSYTDKGGKKSDKTIAYLVTTTPAITFIREDR